MCDTEGGLLLDTGTGKCYSLNQTGATIWSLLAEGKTPLEIGVVLRSEDSHITLEEVLADVYIFVNSLRKRGIIRLNEENIQSTGEPHRMMSVGVVQTSTSSVYEELTKSGRPSCLQTIEAALLLARFDLLLYRRGFPGLYQKIAVGPRTAGSSGPTDLANLVVAVDKASRRYLRTAACLLRSATLVYLLRRHNINAELVFGVRHFPFMAHAWVEVKGVIVNDSKAVRAVYQVIDCC